MLLHLSDFSDMPLHRQVSQQLRDRILVGDLSAGSKLMSRFSFARAHKINVKTIDRAYKHLEELGLIKQEADDYFVSSLPDGGMDPLAKEFAGENAFGSETSFHADPLRAERGSRFYEELKSARDIQSDCLPKLLPSDGQFDLAASYKALNVIGGDLYDYVAVDDSRFGLVIGDACGKGIPGALLISQVQARVRAELQHSRNIRSILGRVNQQVFASTPKDKFVTLFVGLCDRLTGEFEYASAGHNFPILIRRGGRIEFLEAGGPALGVVPSAPYETGKVTLQPQDVLFLYTDGLTESMNPVKDEYGEVRLTRVLQTHRRREVRSILDLVAQDVAAFRDGAPAEDDQTMLAMKVKSLSWQNSR